MKHFKLGSLSVDPAEYASHGNAVLGIRGSGKTYTATLIAERLFDAGIPFIAFDPIGVWRHLRVPGAGKGYPIVVAGGKDGDLPLTVAGVPAIVRAAMQGGVSVVLDLFDMNLSKADWRRIVTAAVRTLMHENHAHGLRHVFIEEAAEFIPQKPTDWDVYAEIEKMARMGGNSRLGYTLINQRSQEVSKAILELCENVFLHRQRGKNALENMDKWLQVAGAAEQKEIIRSLPDLPQGECWAWLGGDTPTPPTHIKVPSKNSAHPDRRVMRGDTSETKAKPVDVGQFVAGMRGQLEAIVEEAKANDPAALKKRIRELEAEVARKAAAAVDEGAIVRAREAGFEAGQAAAAARLKTITDDVHRAKHALELASQALAAPLPTFQRTDTSPARQPAAPNGFPDHIDRRGRGHYSAPSPHRKPIAKATGDGDKTLPRGEKACLICIAQQPNGATREQLTVVTGYKRSSRDAYIQRLREKGYIDATGDRLAATEGGVAALGADYEPMPSGQALREFHLQRLPEGERRVLEMLIASYPSAVPRDAIDEATGYKRSSRDAYLQRLSARQLIVAVGRGEVRASEELFS